MDGSRNHHYILKY